MASYQKTTIYNQKYNTLDYTPFAVQSKWLRLSATKWVFSKESLEK